MNLIKPSDLAKELQLDYYHALHQCEQYETKNTSSKEKKQQKIITSEFFLNYKVKYIYFNILTQK